MHGTLAASYHLEASCPSSISDLFSMISATRFGFLVAVLGLALPAPGSHAAALKQATVTQTYNEVKVVAPSRDDRPAAPGERITGDTGVRTGRLSRAELEFQDKTLTRLGANTIFNFENGTRDLALEQGTMLLQVPKGAGGAKIRTAAITAAITGTSILLEYTPDYNPPPGSKKKKRKGYVKVIVLEGTLRLYLNNRMGESVLLEAGQMLITSPDTLQLPQSVDIDIARLVDTSILVNNRFWQQGKDKPVTGTTRGVGQRGTLSMSLIDEEIIRQRDLIAKGRLIETNLGITGRGTDVMIKSDDILMQVNTRTTVAQSQVGTVTRAAPVNPGDFTIDGTTTIKTDPTITRGTVTATGAIYRGAGTDGPFSRFGFGSTTAFDTTAGFNGSFFGGGTFPATGVAVFRFAGMLTLAGNPILNLAGGPTSLALVGGAGIITTAAPFTFDLTGLSEVLLATEAGPLTIGPGVNFRGANTRLDLYARGTASDLTFNGAASLGSGIFYGAAQRDIQLNGVINSASLSLVAGGSVFLNDSVSTGAVSVNAAQDIVFQSGASIRGSGPLSLTAGRDIIATGGTILTPDPNVTVAAGRDLTAGFFGARSFTIGRNVLLTNSFAFETATVGGSFMVGRILPYLTPTNPQNVFRLSAGSMSMGDIFFDGFASTQPAPTLTLAATGAIFVTNSIFVRGFDGGSLVISGATDALLGNSESVLALQGANAPDAVSNGGRGGSFAATLSGTFTLNSFAALYGGNAIANGSGAGGRGGNFNVTAGSIILASGISVLGGAGATPALDGASGSVSLRSTAGDITVNQQISYQFNTGSVTLNAARDAIFNGLAGTLTINAFVTAGRDITSAFDLALQDATAGGNISAANQIAAHDLTAGSFITAAQIYALHIQAGAAVIATTIGANYIGTVTPAEIPLIDPNNLPTQASITAPGGVTVRDLNFNAFNGAPQQLTINTPGSVVGINGSANFNGSQGSDGTPSIGGNLIINAAVLLVMPEVPFSLRGADSGNALFGGAAGGRLTFTLTQASPLTLEVDGTIIDASGGAAFLTSALAGGNGGRVTINNAGNITLLGDIHASTGANGMGVAFGGSGGNVNIRSGSGTIAITGIIQVSDAGSLNGGSISLTSQATTGDAIVLNGSLLAAQNNSGAGTAGTINLASSGGDIRLLQGSTIGTMGAFNASVILSLAGITGQIFSDGAQVFGISQWFAPTINIGVNGLTGDHINMVIGAGGMTALGSLDAGDGSIASVGSIVGSLDLRARLFAVTGSGSNLSAGGNLTAIGGSISAPGNITVGGVLSLVQDSLGTFGNINAAGGNISAAGGIFTPGDPAVVSAFGSISAPGILTGTLTAGTNITIDNTAGTFGFGIIANTITAGGILTLINSPTISPNNAGTSGSIGFTPVDFTLTAASIVSAGPVIPILQSLGSDAGVFGQNNPGNGGNVVVNVTSGLVIGPAGNLAAIHSYGGAFGPISTAGGDGGTVTINTPGAVTVASGGEINASSGIIPTPTPATIGAGGTVTVNAGDLVDIAGAIRVSHDDPISGPGRRSSTGGSINVKSTRVGGTAIQIQSTGQLLALLNAAAPGPGGKITIVASGAGSSIKMNGKAQADRGTVEVRHDGANGTISTASTTDLRGDIVKIGALGNNGILTIGGGVINADSTIKLYATASNGLVQFTANTTLNAGSFTYIAGQTVTINNGVLVNVLGANPAQVYTSTPNYFGFGGNGSTTGTFTGQGAVTRPFGGQPGF